MNGWYNTMGIGRVRRSAGVAGWDPEATSRRFELAVGRDLQFVRINGTLVGGLVGLAIYTVSQLLR